MKNYKLNYHSDGDDSCPKTFESPTELNIGDVIEVENGFYHCIYDKVIQKTGVRLDLANSASSTTEALLLAQQAGLYPKTPKPQRQRRRA